MTSLVVVARALYSASADEREMVSCFLALKETKESPKKIQNPVTDLRESSQVLQSTSEKARNFKEEAAEKYNPCPGLPLMYRSK